VTEMKENPFEEPVEFDVESAEQTEDPENNESALARAEEELAKHGCKPRWTTSGNA